nr:GntR family transcriptional regulator [uncultured Oscillibacter sp.]
MNYPEPLQEFALTEITRRIQTGEYPVGSRLVAQKIAASLNISATPVVAAINRLAAQGLVETIPRKGAIVKQFSVEDIRNYFDARIMMETYAVKPAIQNVDQHPEVVEELREIVDRFDSVEPTDLEAARVQENRFHPLMVKLAGNAQLDRLYEFNWSVGSVYFVYSLKKVKPENFKISLVEHRQILEALLNKDEARLEFLVKDHLRFLNKALEWYNK